MAPTLLDEKLRKLSYDEIERELLRLGDAEVVALLDSRSRRVGGQAAEFLLARRKADVIVEALLASRLRTKLGRLRATYVLNYCGRQPARSAETYLHLLDDRDVGVLGNALFGLAFLQDERSIGKIEAAREHTRKAEARELFDLAIKALTEQDPFIFAPGYRDSANVWGLDEKRFAGKVWCD